MARIRLWKNSVREVIRDVDANMVIVASLAAFQIKHFIADFVVQTPYQFQNKGKYGHPGGFIHAGIHAIGSLPALWILSASPGAMALVVLAEFVVHYHTDWFKEKLNHRYDLQGTEAPYWMVFGADQFLHQLTYLVIVALLAR